MTPIAMPKIGATMREGRVVSWTREVGDAVDAEQAVVVIETDKAEVEVVATASGVLRHVYVTVGTTVPCGALLGAITASMDEAFDQAAFHRDHHRPDVDALPLPDVPPPIPR